MHGNKPKDFRRRYGEPVGELKEAIKRNGLFRALDPSYLIAVKVTHLRKLLLGEMPFNPQLSDLFAEQNQCLGHAV